MLVGSPPFAADNQMVGVRVRVRVMVNVVVVGSNITLTLTLTHQDIYHKIMRGKYKVPSHFPRAAKEMVSRLLSFNPATRLGCLKSGSSPSSSPEH